VISQRTVILIKMVELLRGGRVATYISFGVVEDLVAGEESEKALAVALARDGVEENIANGLVGFRGQVGPDRLLQRKPAWGAHQLVLQNRQHRACVSNYNCRTPPRRSHTKRDSYQEGAQKSTASRVGIGGHRHREVLLRGWIKDPSHDERFPVDSPNNSR